MTTGGFKLLPYYIRVSYLTTKCIRVMKYWHIGISKYLNKVYWSISINWFFLRLAKMIFNDFWWLFKRFVCFILHTRKPQFFGRASYLFFFCTKAPFYSLQILEKNNASISFSFNGVLPFWKYLAAYLICSFLYFQSQCFLLRFNRTTSLSI